MEANIPAIAPVTLEATPEGRVTVDSLAAAQTWLERLEIDLKDIDWQISRTRRGHPTESRDMTEEEMEAWRGRASRARIYKEREIVELRRYVRESMVVRDQFHELLDEGRRIVGESVLLEESEAARDWYIKVASYLEAA